MTTDTELETPVVNRPWSAWWESRTAQYRPTAWAVGHGDPVTIDHEFSAGTSDRRRVFAFKDQDQAQKAIDEIHGGLRLCNEPETIV